MLVSRNKQRFPIDFFQFISLEYEFLKSQIATSKIRAENNSLLMNLQKEGF